VHVLRGGSIFFVSPGTGAGWADDFFYRVLTPPELAHEHAFQKTSGGL